MAEFFPLGVLDIFRPPCFLHPYLYARNKMIADIRQHLQAGPFEPFSIITSSGDRYRIASPDHAGVHPQGSRVVIWFDDDSSVTVSGLHIVAIEKDTANKSGGAS